MVKLSMSANLLHPLIGAILKNATFSKGFHVFLLTLNSFQSFVEY